MDVIERLRQLQLSDDLPDKAQNVAKSLVSRLSSPVRVTLFGPVGAGKSTLRDVLAGAKIVPTGLKLPSTMLKFGNRERIKVTLRDKSVTTIEGLDFGAVKKLTPALVEIRAPLAGLSKFSLLEVVTDGTPNELATAMRWAAARTDIAIWVTSQFDTNERAVWAKVPDSIKDHAYLVLNKIDLMDPKERDSRKAVLQAVAAQAFHSFYSVSAKLARTDLDIGAAASDLGCRALRKSLERHVELACQADLDGALMFLNCFEGPRKSETRAGPKSRANSRPQKAGNTERAPAAEPTAPSLRAEDISARAGGKDSEAAQLVRRAALDRLRGCANGLLSDWGTLGEAVAEAVLDRCLQTIEDLAGALPPEDQLVEPVLQASDLIVLLQLEKSDVAAENAVTALLQLKREFEVSLAA